MSDYDHISHISHPGDDLQQRISAEAGLSSSSRLHGHLVQIDAVTPEESQQRGAGLLIRHGVAATSFGDIFVALTPRGICKAAFLMPEAHGEGASDSATRPESPALQALQAEWPRARFEADLPMAQALALRLFEAAPDPARPFTLHIHGSDFQLAVWRALLRIPAGSTTHYSAVAAAAGKPAAARATGSAIGANPVAVLIPCHRVIQRSGALGGYRWGPTRKLAIQAWERR